MAPETFKAREIDLLTLEKKVGILEEALAEERQAYDEWKADFEALAEAINAEREARHKLELSHVKDKATWGFSGILIGAVIALAVD
jgi:hypothetical protein